MDRIYFAGALIVMAGALWWLIGQNHDLRDERDHIQTEKETIERIEDAPDIDLSDDGARVGELCRLAGFSDCPM